MDRLDAMALFVAAVDEGSLAAAARRHGRSAASATRAIALLEAASGERLLSRTTRRLSLTAAGESRIAVWRNVLAQLQEETSHAGPGGTIIVTAPEVFGRLTVMPIVEQFLADHHGVCARVLLLNRLVDIVGEGVDFAVRLAPLPDAELTAIRLGEVQGLVCAAPGYLERCGVPTRPQDLSDHDCIGLNADGGQEQWSFSAAPFERARKRSYRTGTRLAVNHAEASIDAALRGGGIIRPLSYQVAGHLAQGRLVRLLADFEPSPTPVHLVFQPALSKSGVRRSFIEHAVGLLRARLTEVSGIVADLPVDARTCLSSLASDDVHGLDDRFRPNDQPT